MDKLMFSPGQRKRAIWPIFRFLGVKVIQQPIALAPGVKSNDSHAATISVDVTREDWSASVAILSPKTVPRRNRFRCESGYQSEAEYEIYCAFGGGKYAMRIF